MSCNTRKDSWAQNPALPESRACVPRSHSALPSGWEWGSQEGRGDGWQKGKAVTWGDHQEPLLSHCLDTVSANPEEERVT